MNDNIIDKLVERLGSILATKDDIADMQGRFDDVQSNVSEIRSDVKDIRSSIEHVRKVSGVSPRVFRDE